MKCGFLFVVSFQNIYQFHLKTASGSFRFLAFFPFVSFFHVLLWFELGAVGFPGLRLRMCLEAVNKEIPVSWVTSRRLTLGPHTISALVPVTIPVLPFHHDSRE